MRYLLFSFLLLTVSCAHQSKVDEDVTLYDGLKAQKYSNIYFSGQPDLKKFSALKAQGFATVINLRQKDEGKYKEGTEKAAVESTDLKYINIPTKGSAPLTDEHVSKITKAIVDNRSNGKVLVHCSSGNRAAMWAGAHFFRDHGFSKKEARRIAKKLGLNKDAPTKTLDSYLEGK